MTKKTEPKCIELMLAEAAELIRQINTDTLKDLQEKHRLQFEKYAQS